jgi:hypothetical protein
MKRLLCFILGHLWEQRTTGARVTCARCGTPMPGGYDNE